ncbi:hypothetical protein KEM52_000037 [Ascosphaera acerosa]|nr:hypothetical protein KEM52_000037 [Ascosphaera acerosa]
MPVKWTPETDQLLFLKVLETHNITIDSKKVVEAWPSSDPSSVPTPKAITEHMRTLRQRFAGGGGSGGTGSGSGNVTPAASPRKKAAGTPRTPRTPKSAGGKRKAKEMGVDAELDDGETDEETALRLPPPKREPSTRVRSPPKPAPGVIVYRDGGEAMNGEGDEDANGAGASPGAGMMAMYDADDDDLDWQAPVEGM